MNWGRRHRKRREVGVERGLDREVETKALKARRWIGEVWRRMSFDIPLSAHCNCQEDSRRRKKARNFEGDGNWQRLDFVHVTTCGFVDVSYPGALFCFLISI
ncbi:hypothetical protein ACFX1W_015709 [Malus domestica]